MGQKSENSLALLILCLVSHKPTSTSSESSRDFGSGFMEGCWKDSFFVVVGQSWFCSSQEKPGNLGPQVIRLVPLG